MRTDDVWATEGNSVGGDSVSIRRPGEWTPLEATDVEVVVQDLQPLELTHACWSGTFVVGTGVLVIDGVTLNALDRVEIRRARPARTSLS